MHSHRVGREAVCLHVRAQGTAAESAGSLMGSGASAAHCACRPARTVRSPGAVPLGGWELRFRASAPRTALEPWTPAVRRVRLETRLPAVLSSAATAAASASRPGRIVAVAWFSRVPVWSAWPGGGEGPGLAGGGGRRGGGGRG